MTPKTDKEHTHINFRRGLIYKLNPLKTLCGFSYVPMTSCTLLPLYDYSSSIYDHTKGSYPEMKFLMHIYDTILIERDLKPLIISQIMVLVIFLFIRFGQLDTWFYTTIWLVVDN